MHESRLILHVRHFLAPVGFTEIPVKSGMQECFSWLIPLIVGNFQRSSLYSLEDKITFPFLMVATLYCEQNPLWPYSEGNILYKLGKKGKYQ